MPEPAKPDAGHVALELTNQLLTGCIGSMLGMQAPVTMITATDVMNLLVEHVAKILSYVEPEQARNAILAEIRRNLPGIVGRHVTARSTTPGGIFIPQDARPN